MPNKDKFHDAVKHALIKDGWRITHEPLPLEYGGVAMQADLGAEEVIGAERGGRKIAVEIKSFIAPSFISEFHTALGQTINYRVALTHSEPDRDLYLAVPVDVYEEFFQLEFTQTVIQEYSLKIIVYSPEREEIIQWTN